MNGVIFDIRGFAIHDGPGIRTTVFFKGCPLSCWWCHNPESQKPGKEIMVRGARCIPDCCECLGVCEKGALSKKERIALEREKCDACGKCAEACHCEALQVVGREASVEEVMAEIEKDSLFYDHSSGGVTFSGGEPLMQPEFLGALLEGCREKRIHTTLDTSGYASFGIMENLSDKIDLFMYDIKLMDDSLHRKYTGVSNRPILQNLGRLSRMHGDIEIRIPLIPGITDTEANLSQMTIFLSSLPNIQRIALLPYHASGRMKYEGLGKENRGSWMTPLLQGKTERIKSDLEKYGFEVKIGG